MRKYISAGPVITIVLLLTIATIDIFASTQYRGLHADGAYYFLLKLVNSTGDVLTIGELPEKLFFRQFAIAITQFPLSLALYLGVRDITALQFLHSLGLIGMPDLFWLLSILLTQGRLRVILISIFLISKVNSSLFEISELRVALSLTALGAAILLHDSLSYARAMLLVLVALALTLSYENPLFGLFLAALSVHRIWWDPNLDRLELACLVSAVALFITGSCFGLWSITQVRNDAYLAGTFFNTWPPSRSLILSTVVLMLAMALTVSRRYQLFLPFILFCFLLFLSEIWKHPMEFYRERLSVALLILVGLCIACIFRPIVAKNRQVSPRDVAPVLLLTVITFLSDVSVSLAWGDFIKTFTQELGSTDRVKVVRETRLVEAPQNSSFRLGKAYRRLAYGWSWTYPTMSIILRPAGSHALFFDANYSGWQPFNAQRTLVDIDVYKAGP